MLNDIQKAQIRRANKTGHIQMLTYYFMDIAAIKGIVNISANKEAENLVQEKIKSKTFFNNELYQLKTA